MVINFCDPVLKPRINCNAVTVDGYDVTNLCSLNPSLQNKGLLVESYIKPPVSIIVHLPINIEVSNVIICTAVGAQRSCALELYTHSQQRFSSWITDDEVGGATQAQVSFPSDSDVNRVYSCIGRVQDDQAQYFNFVNSGYRQDLETGNLPEMPKHCLYGSIKTSELHTKYHRYLDNVSHIVIRITRAIRSSACALKWLEIWGQPSRTCKSAWRHAVIELCWQKYGHQLRQESVSDCNNSGSERKSNTNGSEIHEQPDELPEEFIDPLTQEMMMMPVLLPCGKTIDQTSLDRHIRQLSQWGHSPSDPYTGKEFTEREKPIPNAALKARMDQFLLHHPDIANKVDFRVGRNSSVFCVPAVTHSNLLPKKCSHSEMPSFSIDDQDEYCKPVKRLRSDPSENSRELRKSGMMTESFTRATPKSTASRSLSLNSVCVTQSSHSLSTTQSSHSLSTTQSSHSLSTTQSLHHISSIQSSHPTSSTLSSDHLHHIRQESASDSNNSESDKTSSVVATSDLDKVLQLTLAGLPSFLQKTPNQNDSKNPFCVFCTKCVDISSLYMLECSHLLCKQCLLDKQNWLKCVKCGQSTQRTNVVKAHL